MRSTMGRRHSRYSTEMLTMAAMAAVVAMMTMTTMVQDHKGTYMLIKADVIASDSIAQRNADYASGIKGGNRQSKQKMMMMRRRRRRRRKEGESDESGIGYGESKYKFNGDQIAGNLELVSLLGDGGMRDQRVRVALESWNFCNRVGLSPPASPSAAAHGANPQIRSMNSSSSSSSSDPRGYSMPSPRRADCTDLICIGDVCETEELVTGADNELRFGRAFPRRAQTATAQAPAIRNADDYAVQKELYLGALCETETQAGPWQFWMLMLKNGNFDQSSGLCPTTAPSSSPSSMNIGRRFVDDIKSSSSAFPCFGTGCMNHPQIFHNASTLAQPTTTTCSGNNVSAAASSSCVVSGAPTSLAGGFYGTYDLDIPPGAAIAPDKSYFSVDWRKDATSGSWVFHHVLRVSDKYPWLMLYLRADSTSGPSGGYPWETRGIMLKVPETPNFVVRVALDVRRGGGAESQFYLLDMGGCWKNDGRECDGDGASDVTRYSEMIINPETGGWCRPSDPALCPPYHVDAATGARIARNDTARFPYSAYHLYCAPPNARFAEPPFRTCDPFSNPLPQELLQLLPHPEWSPHGFPSSKGQGWIGDPRSWTLDVGRLSQRLYFYQDPGTPPATRRWTSIDVGTEIYVSRQTETAEWLVTDFDVLEVKPEPTR